MAPTPVFSDLWRLSFQGHLTGGEIFTHGFWASAGVASDATIVGNAADAWLAAWLGSPALSVGATDVRHLFATTVGWDRVTVQHHNPATGLPTADAVPHLTSVTGGGSGQLPPQLSLVQTLWNGRVTGKRRYNRFFPPPFEPSVLGADGRVFSGLPGDLNTAVLAGNAAMVALPAPVSMIYYGDVDHTMLGLVAAKCDDIPDTQRRRRNQLVPVVTTTTF